MRRSTSYKNYHFSCLLFSVVCSFEWIKKRSQNEYHTIEMTPKHHRIQHSCVVTLRFNCKPFFLSFLVDGITLYSLICIFAEILFRWFGLTLPNKNLCALHTLVASYHFRLVFTFFYIPRFRFYFLILFFPCLFNIYCIRMSSFSLLSSIITIIAQWFF